MHCAQSTMPATPSMSTEMKTFTRSACHILAVCWQHAGIHWRTPMPAAPGCTSGAPQLMYGSSASAEIGYALARLRVRRVLVLTDPGVAATGAPQRVANQMSSFGIDARLFDGVHVEPTDASLADAIAAARADGPWD